MRQLTLKTRDAGYRVVDTTLNSIRHGSYTALPREETVRAIGWLDGVSEEVVFAAAGTRVPGPPFADELPRDVDDLSPRKRKAFIDLPRLLIDEEVAGHAEHPPTTREEGLQRPEADDYGRDFRAVERDQNIAIYWVEVVIPPAQRQEPATSPKPSKLERLRRLQDEAATLPATVAARDVGRPSRGQQIRERQDAGPERPEPHTEG